MKADGLGDCQGPIRLVDELTEASEFGLGVIVEHHRMANLTPVRLAIDGVTGFLRLARSKLRAGAEDLGQGSPQASGRDCDKKSASRRPRTTHLLKGTGVRDFGELLQAQVGKYVTSVLSLQSERQVAVVGGERGGCSVRKG